MRVRLTQSRTGQEGAGRQAGVFPKLHSPVTLTKLLKNTPGLGTVKVFGDGFHCLLWPFFSYHAFHLM